MTLHEIAFFTDDVDGLASFYERLLNVAPVHRGEGIAIFDVNGVQVLIHERCDAGSDGPPCENHIAFAVPDVDRAVEDLKRRGLPVQFPPRDYDWGRSAYLRGADGTFIELHQDRRGSSTGG